MYPTFRERHRHWHAEPFMTSRNVREHHGSGRRWLTEGIFPGNFAA
jgi:hypothetical protein